MKLGEDKKEIKRGMERKFHARKRCSLRVDSSAINSMPPSKPFPNGEADGFEVMFEMKMLCSSLNVRVFQLHTYADENT